METKYVTHQKGETFVIYDANLSPKKSRLKRKLGFLFLNLSLTGILLFLSPILFLEIRYRSNQIAFQKKLAPQTEKGTLSGFGKLIWLNEKGILSPDNWNFSLIIPEIGMNIKVEDSVDLTNEKNYQAVLKTGVAHAKGTALPGESGTIYIFGHSTDYPWNIGRYDAYFYPLRYLEEGGEIVIVYQGENYLYKVTEKKVADANELDYLISTENEEKLVLQTCWPPGTNWKRLIVIARPISET